MISFDESGSGEEGFTVTGTDAALSEREREVLFLAADGLTDKEIAVRLQIGTKTVRTYWDRMRAKLGAASRTQCLALALRTAFDSMSKSEQRLKTFVDNMPVMFSAYDERMNVISANKECELVTGYPIEQLVGSSRFFEAAYPDPIERNRIQREFMRRIGDYRNFESQIVCADGQVKTIAWSSTAKENPVSGWASWSIGVDVTERRLAEQQLTASEARYRQLLETSTQGVWIVDTEHRTTFANQRLLDLLGCTMEEIMGERMEAFHSGGDPEILRELMANGASVGSKVSFNFKFRRKDGGILWAAIDVSPLIDGEGNLTGHSAVLQDISHRKRMEHQLKTMLEAYDELLKRTDAPLLRFMPDLTVAWANFALDEADFRKALHPMDQWDAQLRQAFDSGESVTFDAQLLVRKRKVDLKATLLPEPSETFGVASVIAVLDRFELI